MLYHLQYCYGIFISVDTIAFFMFKKIWNSCFRQFLTKSNSSSFARHRKSQQTLLISKTSCRCLQDISWRRLDDAFSVTISCLPRSPQNIFMTSSKCLGGYLQDVFNTSWKTRTCYAEDVFNMSSRHVFKMSSRHVLMTFSRYVFKTSSRLTLKIYWRPKKGVLGRNLYLRSRNIICVWQISA